MQRAIKYRMYPDIEQRRVLQQTFGAVRFVYNHVLEEQIRLYKTVKQHMSYKEAAFYLAHDLKQNYRFLYNADSTSLQKAVRYLEDSYKAFFDHRSGFPKFKSKRLKQSYTAVNNKDSIRYSGSMIKLPKLGFVKIDGHRMPENNWRILNATVSKSPTGEYFVSVDFEIPSVIAENYNIENAIGLDYKSDGLYVGSDGVSADFDKYYRKSESDIRILHKKLSRKHKGSIRYRKMRKALAAKYEKISNQRNDRLHKLSTEIANQYDVVCVESLDLKSISNHKGKYKLGKATCDNGYSKFISLLQYKTEDRGKKLIRIDKLYPSSQLCCKCGKKHPEMKNLQRRIMQCDCCNVMDRDVNAAINIKTEGLRMLTAS